MTSPDSKQHPPFRTSSVPYLSRASDLPSPDRTRSVAEEKPQNPLAVTRDWVKSAAALVGSAGAVIPGDLADQMMFSCVLM